MKIKLITLAFLTSLFSVSCSDNRNEQAAAGYVKIAQTSATAKKMSVNSEFENALATFIKIDSDIQNLVNQYPESPIALRLVSEENIMVGTFKYKDITERIIPKLKNITNPKVKQISRTWAIAAFEDNWQDAFKVLHSMVVKDSNFAQELKDEISKNLPIPTTINTTAQVGKKTSIEKRATTQKMLSAKEMKKLLEDAKQNARYCAFELKAAEALLEKSKSITNDYRMEFSAILQEALKRSEQISVVSLREKSFALLAAAAAQTNDEILTMQIISKIKDSNAFEKVFVELASTIGKTKNYPTALAIASKIKTQKIKDDFLAQLAYNVVTQNKVNPAIEIAKQISQVQQKNATICKIASLAYDAKNYKDFISAITNIDVSNLECLSEFLKYETNTVTEKTIPTSAAVLAKITIPLNQKIGMYLTNLSVEKYSGGLITAEIITDNLLALKEYQKATDFVRVKTHEKLTREQSFALLTHVAISGLEFDKPEALKTLKNLVLRSKVEDVATKIFIAYDIEKSKLSETEKTEILKPLLNLK